MIPITKKEVYSARYPEGTIIELTAPIEDDYGGSKPVGARFCVEYMDDALQLHGHWLAPERGSLAVEIEKDSFKVVK
jgi:hypothetical protein